MKLLTPFIILLLISCKQTITDYTAQEIIDKTIETAGGALYEKAEILFTFRGIHYKSIRNNGMFSLQRILPDTLNTIDLLTNDGFMRLQKSTQVNLADSLKVNYSESVNSVHYFMQLPYGLNGPAVNKKLLPSVTIKGKDYYKVEVTFNQVGGGIDFEDVFLFWISKESFTVDYLAYLFYTDEGGIRFRESINPRVIEGIRFVDYNNYRPHTKEIDFYSIDQWFESDSLIPLSVIEKHNIRVRLLN